MPQTTEDWEYFTYVFEPSRKKAAKEVLKNVLIGLLILVIVAFTFFFSVSIGLITAIGAVVALIKTKIQNDKEEGIRRFGEKKAKMRLTEDFLYVNQAVIPFDEVDNLLIYADESSLAFPFTDSPPYMSNHA